MIPAVKDAIPHYSLWKAYRENEDKHSQEYLIKQYLHLVDKVANQLSKKIPQNLISREDLVGMGHIGLIEAIRKFDYQKGYQFETYGLWRIKGSMLDGLRQMDWVPRGSREKAKKLNEANRILEQKLQRIPSEDELSQYLEIPIEEVKQGFAVLSLSTLLSLNEPIQANEEGGNQQSRLDQLGDVEIIPQDQQVLIRRIPPNAC